MGMIVENQIVMKRINEIKPYARNPRKNEKTVELLCRLIPAVGFNVPLVIDDRGVIVKGHARYAAAIRLGLKEVPCIVDHASEEAIKIDRITDNKIAEYSEWVNEEVAEEIESIETDIDFSGLGFPVVKLDEMPVEPLKSPVGAVSGDNGGIVGDKQEIAPEGVKMAPKKYYKCVCEKCGHVMFVEAGAFSHG